MSIRSLWKRISRTINIPFDPRDKESNRDSIVASLINFGLLILGIYTIPAAIYRGIAAPQVLATFAMLLILVFCRILVSRGYATQVSLFLVVAAWLFVQGVILFFENGLRAPAHSAGLLFIIVYVGLIHNTRSLVIITILSVFTSLVVWTLEMQGVFLTDPRIPDNTWALIAQAVFFPAVAYMVSRTIYNQRRSIELYKTENQARLQSEEHIRHINRDLEKAYENTLEGWARALEMHNKETVGHSRRVTTLAMELGKQLNMETADIQQVRFGALLHDIGKMGIPNSILNKPGPLTAEERALVEKHTTYAYELLKDIDYLQRAIEIPYYHHENWDGSGYPQGLSGEEIPLPARIFAIVDNWDALTSDRPYRAAWSPKETLDYITEQTGKKFDPDLVPYFLAIISDLR